MELEFWLAYSHKGAVNMDITKDPNSISQKLIFSILLSRSELTDLFFFQWCMATILNILFCFLDWNLDRPRMRKNPIIIFLWSTFKLKILQNSLNEFFRQSHHPVFLFILGFFVYSLTFSCTSLMENIVVRLSLLFYIILQNTLSRLAILPLKPD